MGPLPGSSQREATPHWWRSKTSGWRLVRGTHTASASSSSKVAACEAWCVWRTLCVDKVLFWCLVASANTRCTGRCAAVSRRLQGCWLTSRSVARNVTIKVKRSHWFFFLFFFLAKKLISQNAKKRKEKNKAPNNPGVVQSGSSRPWRNLLHPSYLQQTTASSALWLT